MKPTPLAVLPVGSTERQQRTVLGLLGIVALALVVTVLVLVFATFGGDFSSYAVLRAVLPASSTALNPGTAVEYRDVSIGTVTSSTHLTPGGLTTVVLHLHRSELAHIPADVQATVAPVSIFGNQYLVLSAPADIGVARLAPGDTIGAAPPAPTNSVQATISDLDHLLIALHPAQLDTALTAVATAVQGQGYSIGQTLDGLSTYLGEMQPLWPTVLADLKALPPVANQLAASTPAILGALAHFSTTSRTISAAGSQVGGLFGGAADLTATTTQILSEAEGPLTTLIRGSGPLLAAVSADPEDLLQLLGGLEQFSLGVGQATSQGPYITATATIPVVNPANLALGALGGPDMLAELATGLGPGYIDPPTYTAGGGLAASSLVPAAPASSASALHASAASHAGASGTSGASGTLTALSLPEPATEEATSTVAAAISGTRPEAPAVTAVLLAPLLAGLSGQA